jgi:hypothetical protein
VTQAEAQLASYRAAAVNGKAEFDQGNRVKESCCDEACEEVVVPSGDFSLET